MVYDANNLYVYADVNDATVQTKPEEVDGKRRATLGMAT